MHIHIILVCLWLQVLEAGMGINAPHFRHSPAGNYGCASQRRFELTIWLVAHLHMQYHRYTVYHYVIDAVYYISLCFLYLTNHPIAAISRKFIFLSRTIKRQIRYPKKNCRHRQPNPLPRAKIKKNGKWMLVPPKKNLLVLMMVIAIRRFPKWRVSPNDPF